MIRDILVTEQRSAIERYCRDRARAVPMPDRMTLCRVLGELKMVVTLDDFAMAPHLALDGYWKTWNAMCLAKNLVRGWKSIDVGASYGYFTILIARLTGAEVEALDPHEGLMRMLAHTVAMNGLSGLVKTMTEAAYSESGEGYLAVAPGNIGSGFVVKKQEAASVDINRGFHGPVPLRPLDETSFSPVNFIKLDAQGKEPEVWQGMQRLLGTSELKAVLLSWKPERYADPRGFLETIAKRDGFRVAVIDGTGTAVPGDVLFSGEQDLWLSR